ncbi:glutaminyl-peptide cyclotransferase-like [Mizuhopecten yessoensis]|uniref:Glutaminyl-peptide cyclotransferase n=1 Tax=Mizuhopecten yessoensis TaxID=6573 RepID=A0A210QRS4_MIZYE|nr:glutaminyl-peptide cyclotransferase-like [Mizuhopecten yessoensis]OWF51456.1 Glutaminyl-peptide cyclotransferase [Mizuhopecten yessoensis]
MANVIVGLTVVLVLLCASFSASKSQKPKIQQMKYRSSKAFQILAEEYTDHLTFEYLVNQILVPRVPGTQGNKQVGDFIKITLEAMGWYVEEDIFEDMTPHGMKTFRNIIGTYDISKPQRLVLAAHYDSKNITSSKGQEFLGATDSAVPCAILLDVARQLDCLLTKGNGKMAENLTPQLVFFDGEEAFLEWTAHDSLYGARHLAAKWADSPHPIFNEKSYLSSITAFVLLDLIGSTDVTFTSFFPQTEDLFEYLVKVEETLTEKKFLNSTGLERRQKLFHSSRYSGFMGGGIEDDHKPFEKRGVPILHLISYPFPKVWHKMSDNGKAIDYAVTENFNRIFRTFVADFLHLDANHNGCRRRRK